jgi:hypothetical protein
MCVGYVQLTPLSLVSCCLQDKGFIRDAVLQAYKDQMDEDKAEEFLQKIVQVSLGGTFEHLHTCIPPAHS